MEWMRTKDTLSHCVVCAQSESVREKLSCEMYLSTLPVGHNGSLSTVNETNCNKNQFFQKMSSLPIPSRLVAPRCAWRWMPSSLLIWMDTLFNLFSWFVVWTIFHRDSGSKIRSKLHKPIFACFAQSKIPLSFVLSLFIWSEFVCMVFLCKFIPLFALVYCPSDCELWFTINRISQKSIVNTCKMFTLRVDFLTASLPRIPSLMVLILYFGFAMPNTMSGSFLYHVVRNRECIQS